MQRKSRAKNGPRKKRVHVPHRSIIAGAIMTRADQRINVDHDYCASDAGGDTGDVVDLDAGESSPATREELYDEYYRTVASSNMSIPARGVWFALPDVQLRRTSRNSAQSAAWKLSKRDFVHATMDDNRFTCSCGGVGATCCHLFALQAHYGTLMSRSMHGPRLLNICVDFRDDHVVQLFYQPRPIRRILSVLRTASDHRSPPIVVRQQSRVVAGEGRSLRVVDHGFRCSVCAVDRNCGHIKAAMDFVATIEGDYSPATDSQPNSADVGAGSDDDDELRCISTAPLPLPSTLVVASADGANLVSSAVVAN